MPASFFDIQPLSVFARLVLRMVQKKILHVQARGGPARRHDIPHLYYRIL